MIAVGNDPLGGAVGLHDTDLEPVAILLGEGDIGIVGIGRKHRRGIAASAEADAARRRAIGAHHVDLLRAAAIGFEHDLRAIR